MAAPDNYMLDLATEYKKAEHALEAHRYDLVIRIMHDILSALPEESKAFVYIARANFLKDNLPGALDAVKEGLRLDPNNDYAHALYAAVLWHNGGDKEQAEEEFLTALELNPLNDVTYYWYGVFLLFIMNDIVKSREYLTQALKFNPQNENCYVLLAKIYEKEGKLLQAENMYCEALRLNPENFLTLNSYGEYLLDIKKRPKEALEIFEKAIRLAPDDITVQDNFTRCRISQKKLNVFTYYYLHALELMGHFRWFVLVGFILLPELLLKLTRENPSLFPFLFPFIVVSTIICLYAWFIEFGVWRVLSR